MALVPLHEEEWDSAQLELNSSSVGEQGGHLIKVLCVCLKNYSWIASGECRMMCHHLMATGFIEMFLYVLSDTFVHENNSMLYLDTGKQTESNHYYRNLHYFRVRKFSCEKCLC